MLASSRRMLGTFSVQRSYKYLRLRKKSRIALESLLQPAQERLAYLKSGDYDMLAGMKNACDDSEESAIESERGASHDTRLGVRVGDCVRSPTGLRAGCSY
jgi:hypothetical protein